MIVEMQASFRVTMSAAEFRIITLALSGRKLSRDEADEALALNERMCDLRVRQIQEITDIAVGAHRKATELLSAANQP